MYTKESRFSLESNKRLIKISEIKQSADNPNDTHLTIQLSRTTLCI